MPKPEPGPRFDPECDHNSPCVCFYPEHALVPKPKHPMLKRHLTALFHRTRCDRQVLLPMLDKLEPGEIEALYRLVQAIEEDAKRSGVRQGARQPWRGV